jgi:hypothetical protein
VRPLGNVPDYLAAWDLVVGGQPDAGDAARTAGNVRGDYLAAAVRDVVLQTGSISGTMAGSLPHPISLRAHPTAPGYLLEYVDAIDHGLYVDQAETFSTVWEAAVQYVRLAWPREIQGLVVRWDV